MIRSKGSFAQEKARKYLEAPGSDYPGAELPHEIWRNRSESFRMKML